MLKNFMTSLEIARKQINDPLFMFANRTKSTYFTKETSKMNFGDAIYFILKGLRKTLQIEIDNWFEFLGGENTMTKQAFSQLRQKIKPDAFIQLNEVIVSQIEQVLELQITFLGGVGAGISGVGGAGGSFGSVGSGVNCMISSVGGCCGVTGGTGGGASCSLIGTSISGVGGKCGSASFAHRYLTTHPGTPCFNSFSRPVVFRVLLLEI